MEKQTTYCAMMRLGLAIPDTWMIPPKAYDPAADLDPTLQRYARLFDLGAVGKKIGYPHFMKPYDGGGWVGVTQIGNERELRDAYEKSGKMLMHLQAAVQPHDAFIRCVGLGPTVHLVHYDPSAPLHARYVAGPCTLSDSDQQRLRDITLIINSFFLWDFNSCECLRNQGEWYPIDFANPCPDSQVTSLHWHFPALIMAKVRWSLFVAATDRKVRMNQDWAPYLKIADTADLSQEEKFKGYTALAAKHFETEKFEAFCAEQIPHLEEVTRDFFGTDTAREAVRQKVTALFPAHEIDSFTDYFWGKIQEWRNG